MIKKKKKKNFLNIKNRLTSRDIAINAILVAIFLLFCFVPWLGYLPIGIVSITLMHILFLIATYALFISTNINLVFSAIIYGMLFGITSFLRELIYPDAAAFIFTNPLFSIVPRLLLGIVIGSLFFLLNILNQKIDKFVLEKKINLKNNLWIKNFYIKHHYLISYIIIAFFTAFFNTLFVLCFMYFIGPLIFVNPDQQTFFKAFSYIILLTNYLPETIIILFIFPPVASALKKIYTM